MKLPDKFVIKDTNRDGLKKYLLEQGIETQIHYQENFNNSILGRKQGNYSKTHMLCNSVLSIPNNQFLYDYEVEKIARSLRTYYGKV